jgi:CRP/FNR family transcriptional regulator, cyclic AMP receptor protein
VAACPPLAHLPGPVLDLTVERAWLRTLAPGEALYRTGDPGDAMFVVASGRIAARLSSPDGDTIDLMVMTAGSLVGYLELLDGGRRCADAVAVTPSRVVVIGAGVATYLLETTSALLLAVAQDMAARIRAHTDAAREQAFHPVTARLARFLLDAADARGRVLLDGPQVLLAQRLGVARQTLSKALRGLARDGLVRVESSGRAVTIVDRAGLTATTDLVTRRRSRPRSAATSPPPPSAPTVTAATPTHFPPGTGRPGRGRAR